MVNLNVDSFKIEGRMRSIYYIATIVWVYRHAIDEYFKNPKTYSYNKTYEYILRNCANRDSVVQFFNGVNDESCGYYNGRTEISNQDFLGIVLDYEKEHKLALVEMRNYFKIGDQAEVFGPNTEPYLFKIEQIYDENEDSIEVVRHPKQIVKIFLPIKVNPYDLIRLKS